MDSKVVYVTEQDQGCISGLERRLRGTGCRAERLLWRVVLGNRRPGKLASGNAMPQSSSRTYCPTPETVTQTFSREGAAGSSDAQIAPRPQPHYLVYLLKELGVSEDCRPYETTTM